jgi:hypothetical protein
MNQTDRYCPVVEIPATIAEAHPKCFALIADLCGRLAVVDPDMTPKPNGQEQAYIVAGRHSYVSPYFRIMGQVVLTSHGVTFPEAAVEIVGAVVWCSLQHERIRSAKAALAGGREHASY